jgi:hypothetical protein
VERVSPRALYTRPREATFCQLQPRRPPCAA